MSTAGKLGKLRNLAVGELVGQVEKQIIKEGGKAVVKEIEKVTVKTATQQAQQWLGQGYKGVTNKAGDYVFVSKDGLRKLRFDIRNPLPHKNPHMHLEELHNGKWKGIRIYPKDVLPH